MSDASAALIVVDVQRGFDAPDWGPSTNPGCEERIGTLIASWRERGWPVVFVRHSWDEEGSPLQPGTPGHEFKDVLQGIEPDLLVDKDVHSAFHGEPDLDAWLRERGIERIVVCGITTNHCCETTARLGCDLGYEVRFAIDATRAFDAQTPEGDPVPADLVMRMTAVNLDGEFAQVLRAEDVVASLEAPAPRA